MRRLTADQVRLDVAADVDTVYSIVADVTRTPEWSPQVVSCTWIPPATGPEVGARFRATNGAKRHTWSNVPMVETADPGREFAFVRTARLGGTIRWRYRLEPIQGGTTVVESYEVVRPVPRLLHLLVRLSGVPDLAADLRANMQASLRRLAEIAEREAQQRRPTVGDERRPPQLDRESGSWSIGSAKGQQPHSW